ncbi:FtsB family cell division protein [Alkalihalobacillus sp. 1P02AB]|uniref:FtsB family cell division protein n=1 Tax=Alkalihalobacillus sp. 1P02AB TaxID=3132260 RepID=UPI0039A4F046
MISNQKSTIREIDSAYKQQREQELAIQQKKRRGLMKRLTAIGILGALFAAIGGILLYNQMVLTTEKNEEKAALELELEQLKAEQQYLEQEIVNYNDLDYIAEIARRDYFFTKKGETLFTLPNTSSD